MAPEPTPPTPGSQACGSGAVREFTCFLPPAHSFVTRALGEGRNGCTQSTGPGMEGVPGAQQSRREHSPCPRARVCCVPRGFSGSGEDRQGLRRRGPHSRADAEHRYPCTVGSGPGGNTGRAETVAWGLIHRVSSGWARTLHQRAGGPAWLANGIIYYHRKPHFGFVW